MRFWAIILGTIVSLTAPALAQGERTFSGAALDAQVRETSGWLVDVQTVMNELYAGPVDATQSLEIYTAFDLGELTDGEARGALERVTEAKRQQLDSIRARYRSISRPARMPSPSFTEFADRVEAGMESMFEQAENVLDIERQMIGRLSDKDATYDDLIIADFTSRRLLVELMIEFNEGARLAIEAGHPQDFLLNAMNAGSRAIIVFIDLQEYFVTQWTLDGTDPFVERVGEQVRLMRRYAGAGRNAIAPSLTRAEELRRLLPDSELLRVQPQVFATYEDSFEHIDAMADVLETFQQDFPQVTAEEEFWTVVDTALLAFAQTEEDLMETQNRRAQMLLAGQ